MNVKALSIKRKEDDINTEHNSKNLCSAAVAQWTKRLTRYGQTRAQIWKSALRISLLKKYSYIRALLSYVVLCKLPVLALYLYTTRINSTQ